MDKKETIPDTAPRIADVWNRAEALERIGGDESLLQELCQIFLAGYPRLIEQLRAAVMLGDAAAVQNAAHSLKGELSYLGAPQATGIARSIENMGREKNLSSAITSLASLEQSLTLLHLAIENATGIH